ncbi:MAG: hypothetical protein EHM72_02760 [Calditrichaeota bacterium]|nr:MAG: hypothetical protein EHM72_02760 [Calditrichota bacterium]
MMNVNNQMIKIIVAIFMLVNAMISNVSADVYFKQKVHTDAMQIMGQSQPAQNYVSEIWITPSKAGMSSEKNKTVIDFDKKMIILADHVRKTFMQMPLDFSKAFNTDMTVQENAEMKEFMGKMMEIKVTVQPTDDMKNINQWHCRKYLQTVTTAMGEVKSEIWATSSIALDLDLYSKFSAAMMAQMPGVSQNLGKMMEEMKKIKGVQVFSSTQTEMMGQTFGSSTELLEYKEGKAPVEAFNIPAEYKKQDMF